MASKVLSFLHLTVDVAVTCRSQHDNCSHYNPICTPQSAQHINYIYGNKLHENVKQISCHLPTILASLKDNS